MALPLLAKFYYKLTDARGFARVDGFSDFIFQIKVPLITPWYTSCLPIKVPSKSVHPFQRIFGTIKHTVRKTKIVKNLFFVACIV